MSGLICASLGTSSEHVLNALEQLDPLLEMAEVRIDLLKDYAEVIESIFEKAKELGVQTIATVREIQADPGFSKTRSDLVTRCLASGCTYVDVELEAPDQYRNEIVSSAKANKVLVIVSHHDYASEEKSSENLDKVVSECFAKGADVAKVAVSVCSYQGASRVLALYNDSRPIVALGMGENGRVTRLASILLGAPFSFAAWDSDSATAPGQLTRETMKSGLAIMGWKGTTKRLKQGE
jgi:3-dehydroquinate dehydratase I